jgi:hypothetical protein
MTAARIADGPSRPVGLELGLAAGILVVVTVVIGIATIGSLGSLAIPYLLLSFLPGLLVWVPLLLVSRRLARTRSAGLRVLGSVVAALIAIGVDFVVVTLIVAPLAGYWGLFVAFAFIESIVFLAAALVAAFIVHLGAPRAR